MIKYCIGILFLLTLSLSVQAQVTKFEKIKEARKEFIAKRLNLKTDQKNKFLDTYDTYAVEKEQLRKKRRQLRQTSVSLTASDDELLASVEQLINLQQKEVDIEKKYMQQFKSFLSPRQLVEMYRSDKEFNRILLNKLRGE
ncbi:MAG: Spy/CpxP family protein refolding chaperone [Thermonemataceae bacterium]